MFNSVLQSLPFVKSGKLKALAVSSLKRSPAVPDLPTLSESGVPGYDISNWFGILAPGATPRPLITKLHGEIVRHSTSPELRNRLAAEGAEVVGSSPEELGRTMRTDIEKYGKIVKAAKVRID
jgi:tripartite-type tricarboxylate transporter receptor subunit TctC